MNALRAVLLILAAMINLASAMPLEGAIDSISARTPIGSVLRSADWAKLPIGLRESSQFSAGVESMRVMQRIQDRVLQMVKMERSKLAGGKEGAFFDRAKFIAELRRIAIEEGLTPADPADRDTLKDITSEGRLGLIFDIQTQRASEFARWKVEQDADVLDAYPCQELIRVEHRETPRPWRARWVALGGRLFNDRMIARKDDPIWRQLSRFGTPWPPFDFHSGMGLDDIGRDEAEALGVIAPADVIPPQDGAFTDELKASVRGVNPKLLGALKTIFDDQVEISGDTVAWKSAPDVTLANSRSYRRDSLGRFARDGGPLGVRDNIARGTRAVRRAMATQADVPNAMNRKELGAIDFPWGTPGHAAQDYAGGFGISHILAKHGRRDVLALPQALALGKISAHPTDPLKRFVDHGNYRAVVVKDNRRSVWVLTGFEQGGHA